MISVTKIFEFAACHHIPKHNGKCSRPHGHNYKLEVTYSIYKSNEEYLKTGMVMDFFALKSFVESEVVSRLDHTDLNDILKNPTVENLIGWIKERLEIPRKIPHLTRIKLWESSTSFAEWEE